MIDPISVILPIHRWHDRVGPAIQSILDQTCTGFELIIVLNGGDESIRDRHDQLCDLDGRIRVLHVEQPRLATALNFGIGHATHELIARMDSDDLSHPDRFAKQARYMMEHPTIAGCGTGARFVDQDGTLCDIVIPPTNPAQSRWRVQIWNPFVHGSMMLRKAAVLDAGGYDEQIQRGQDYDLWTRLAPIGLGGVSDILYTHTLDATKDHQLDEVQSQITASRLSNQWEKLSDTSPDGFVDAMAMIARGDLKGRVLIEEMMEANGPTRPLLMAWMWSCWRHPIAKTNTQQRISRLRAIRPILESDGITRVWIWGAGDLGNFIIGSQQLVGVEIAGVLDDHRTGHSLGAFVVRSPNSVGIDELRGSAVIIASELYEDQIWTQSLSMRKQGIRVLRFTLVDRPSKKSIRKWASVES